MQRMEFEWCDIEDMVRTEFKGELFKVDEFDYGDGRTVVGEIDFEPGPGRKATAWVVRGASGRYALGLTEESGRPPGGEVAANRTATIQSTFQGLEEAIRRRIEAFMARSGRA